MIHDNALSLIGKTPLVKLNAVNPYKNVQVVAKVECQSIGGSVKDRVAVAMVEDAMKKKILTKDKIVIEATSGNTGIGLTMVCSIYGFKILLLMPETASEERKRILRAYGADLLLTPGEKGIDGSIEEAYRMAREEPEKYVLLDQYNNPACVEAHYHNTAVEIWNDTDHKVTNVVVALGTSGTAMGVAKKLKELNPSIRITAVEPPPGSKIQGLKNMAISYTPMIYDKNVVDDTFVSEDEAAFDLARRMAREEGLLVGMSSGAALHGALDVASKLKEGLVVFVCPDSGERYMTTLLFNQPAYDGIRLHDFALDRSHYLLSLAQAKEPVGLFTFGSRDPSDIEGWRRVLLMDVLGRYLRRERNHDVMCCVGLADMDDAALRDAIEAGLSVEAHGTAVKDMMERTADYLAIGNQVKFVGAQACRESSFDLIGKLVSKGLAYERHHCVYFDVSRCSGYGNVGRVALETTQAGKTVDMTEYVKDDPRDFTLLKRATLPDLKNGFFLESDFGKVRPSWFLQMASIATAALPSINLVIGGEIHQFPHLDNFAGIWSGASGISPRVWMVTEPVVRGTKVAQDLRLDIDGVSDLLPGGRALRMWILSSSYHKPLVFSVPSVVSWGKMWRRLQDLFETVYRIAKNRRSGQGPPPASAVDKEISDASCSIHEALANAMEEDLSLHKFWPVLARFVKSMYGRISQKDPSALGMTNAETIVTCLERVDGILGILDHDRLPFCRAEWPEELVQAIQDREAARAAKNWDEADQLRKQIDGMGFMIQDTATGPELHRK